MSAMAAGSSVAVITPTYAGDAALCVELNRSLMEHTTGWTHYIVADHRDLGYFKSLRNDRTVLVAKEELLPPGFRRLPRSRRWLSRYTIRPLGGWLVQQIAKFASATHFDEEVLVCMDSDVTVFADLHDTDFVRDGRVRLFWLPDGIDAGMVHHVEWHRSACRLLGVAPDEPPMPDFIATTVSWSRDVVRGMLARIESVTGRPWYAAVAATPQFSEGLTYGAYVQKVLGPDAPVWLDPSDRTVNYWDATPLEPTAVAGLLATREEGDKLLMISSHSRTAVPLRRDVAARLAAGEGAAAG
ncbi:MAG TPA: DUF6492 family protein [Acidimicrobiales bacterium]|nr:DUF6492 family protein [Acidimicrobiales bacterium]